MDAIVLRAEIKTWERSFKAHNGKEPSIDDIKADQEIAAKYKLYKKLVKEAKEKANSMNENDLTTPRRSKHESARDSPAIIPKARAIFSSQEPSGSNPFSPRKPKNNGTLVKGSLPSRPFSFDAPTTPVRKRTYSTPSPEHSPSDHDHTADHLPAEGTSHGGLKTSKARKRLRGEVVSPSPKRLDKKHRTVVARAKSSQLKLRNPPADTDSRYTEKDDVLETPFVADSPVKPSQNRKHFKTLFEEDSIPKRASRKDRGFHHSTSYSLSLSRNSGKKFAMSGPKGTLSMPDPLDINNVTVDGAFAPAAEYDQSTAVSGSSGQKRTSLDDHPEPPGLEHHSDRLLPPSPTSSTNGGSKIAAAKAKKRQRLVLEDGSSDRDTSEEPNDLQVVDVKASYRMKLKYHARENDSDSDPHEHIIQHHALDMPLLAEVEGGETQISVDLPEELRTVLHISPSRAREREERVLVESVLQGSRERLQRGLVWGAGESEDLTGAATDGEGDWAGEGVPWEVGEL